MDSILRRFYIPDVVLREVRLTDVASVSEVIDGQQRITTVQSYFDGEFPLPNSLKDFESDLVGKRYEELGTDFRKYIDKLEFQVDKIRGIEVKDNASHQLIATEIFWRLQQGESLNSMEVAHARLSSRVRNFLVQYSDDIEFDFENYKPVESNPKKHRFFQIINRGNGRMEHLAMLARMLLIEVEEGYTDLKDKSVQQLIEGTQVEAGIGDLSYAQEPAAKNVLRVLDIIVGILKEDPMLADGGKVAELNREYFILSYYLLVRHLNRYYVLDERLQQLLADFLYDFHKRWRTAEERDLDIALFSNSRQQGANDLRDRDLIIRQIFFDYADQHDVGVLRKDNKRVFSESQRIEIFRRDKGLCQMCLAAGLPEKEAQVSWNDYQADHVLAWSKGGETDEGNGQVLCSRHNQSKGAT